MRTASPPQFLSRARKQDGCPRVKPSASKIDINHDARMFTSPTRPSAMRVGRGKARRSPAAIRRPTWLSDPAEYRVSGIRHRRDDDDLDTCAGDRDADLSAVAGRTTAFGDPGIPDFIHRIVIAHVMEPER